MFCKILYYPQQKISLPKVSKLMGRLDIQVRKPAGFFVFSQRFARKDKFTRSFAVLGDVIIFSKH